MDHAGCPSNGITVLTRAKFKNVLMCYYNLPLMIQPSLRDMSWHEIQFDTNK